MVTDRMKGVAVFFLSLSVVIMMGQPMCSKSVNIQGREVCVAARVCVCITNKSHAVEREP